MKHNWPGFGIIFLFGILVCSTGFCGKIIYPWNATTAIVETGDHFTIWYNADSGQNVISVALRGSYCTIPLSFVNKEKGAWVYDTISGNTYNTRMTVNVPSGTPADRYDLILSTSTGQELSSKSVKVIKKYKTDYTILHISDTHMCQGAKINGHPERLFKISKLAEFANIIGAEMVFVTGDLINNNMFPPRRRAAFFYEGYVPAGLKGMYGFNAATFSVVGNHDFLEGQQPGTGFYQEKAQLWNDCHGLQHHQFTYGPTRFMVVNDGWNGFNWSYQLEDHASWLKTVGQGDLRVAAYHKSELGIMGAWANKIDLSLAMIGHNHHLAKDNPYELGGRSIQYYANSLREHFCFNLFRVKADGSYTVANNKDVVENPTDAPSEWLPNLSLAYNKANDGTAGSNTAMIVNKYDISFPRAKVRFVMPKGDAYDVSQGVVEQAFDGDTVHVVDVCVPVNAASTASIEIYKIESSQENRTLFQSATGDGPN